MPDRTAASFGATVAAHLTHVCRRACGAPPDGLEPVLRWVSDCARAQPTSLRLPLLGGRLEVRSQPGEGATVQAWLPAEVQEERTL